MPCAAMIPRSPSSAPASAVCWAAAIITEQVFVINGLGTYLINAINTVNYPVVQSTVLVIATMFVLINLAVGSDLLPGRPPSQV